MSIEQVKTAFNIADVNTKALNKDRHLLCLLFLLGFVSNDEPVGEMEYTRMEAREMLKQQVRLIKETVDDRTQCIPCSQSNKFAKLWKCLPRTLGSWYSQQTVLARLVENYSKHKKQSSSHCSHAKRMSTEMNVSSEAS